MTFGTGEVPGQKFLEALKQIDYGGPLAFEREAGNSREADIAAGDARLAVRDLRDHLERPGAE